MQALRPWVFGLGAAALLGVGCERKGESAGASTTGAAGDGVPAPGKPVEAAATPVKPAEPSLAELLMSKPALADAIALLRDQMTDTDDETSPGALLLAVWAMKHLTWDEVAVAKNETSFKLVRKDSDASRGKRMCLRGQIIQISKEKLDNGALFSGLMLTGYSEITSFIVAGSTGALVESSRARLCGVVIGTYDYSNSGGGKGHAISVVGMFDLPENRGE